VSPSASPPAVPCPGDCDGDGQVTVAELVLGIEIALGRGDDQCPAFDTNRDGRIGIDELIEVVNASLTGCAMAAAS
jgi:Ca2+-binding EF-hand superfamily protein